jgi:hypothetical protein
MVLSLKILLFILSVACALTVKFVYSEFKDVLKSTEFDEGSIFDRFIIYLMATGSVAILVTIALFSAFLLFCRITVEIPW